MPRWLSVTAEVPTFLIAGHETTRYGSSVSFPAHFVLKEDAARRQHGRCLLWRRPQMFKPSFERNFSASLLRIRPWMNYRHCVISTLLCVRLFACIHPRNL
jgi:hypothetical protein